jgi:hypothetical protein
MEFKYNVVSELQNYMFSKTVIPNDVIPNDVIIPIPKVIPKVIMSIPKVVISKVIMSIPIPKVIIPIPSPFFSPRVSDQLFWCFYVMKNGVVAYEMEQSTFVKEKEEKIKYVLLLRNCKGLLKTHKIGKDFETNLSFDKTINLSTFFALCALENINAVVLRSQLYSDICANPLCTTTFVLNQNKHKTTLVLEQCPTADLQYEKTHFKLPLKSISAYKLCDLQNICTRLNLIVPPECKKKQAIYALITDALNKID